MMLTLGSLFDGSGGFPLAALYVGIEPIWVSKIELLPILVTTKRLPKVQHLGDVNAIYGADVEPVDVITFGSRCQNLSVAGKHFQAVLTSLVQVAEPEAPTVPIPRKDWPTAGVLVVGGFSVAWRVLDGQHFGVPQRRRRIFLTADFVGQRCPRGSF
ncbi:DNA cytosine methyltransferase [Gleimia hominis]|uniref:DNA cytosine methyltransferase n=1 Tax=Gleimia hominis TaxID=595468 RepID=UPI001E3DE60F|nr:DNA cytosine methyltransferase [Gleimia hominis]WIK65062.1 DNA cytosine methyltransferase [Gleimia hominis]